MNTELEEIWKVVVSLGHYPGICLEAPRKVVKNFSQGNRYPDKGLNPGPPKDKARAT
jgi:hypothetical protein